MRGERGWSHTPYRPPLWEVGEIYICRISPRADSVLIEWLTDEVSCSVYFRPRGVGDYRKFCDTGDGYCLLTGLLPDTDHEVYVSSGSKRSRVRLVRCGNTVGSVVNYLHPDDEAYAFSGRYLCSPSLLRHPDGYLLASMDVYAPEQPQNLTLIFRSDDGGESWHYLTELMPCFWGKLFIHRGELYMLSTSTEYGDLLIGRSTDGGRSFSTPTVLLRGSGGKGGCSGVHKNPQNIVSYRGRLYTTLEWGSWYNTEYCHAAMVMSCDENADLLSPESWSFTEPRRFEKFVEELCDLPSATMTIEGTLVISPEDKLLNVVRFGKYNTALVYEVSDSDHEAALQYSRLMDFPANYSKFMIKWDAVSGYYYSIGARVYSPDKTGARNLLSLMRSRDLVTWEVALDIFDYRHADERLVGFQYVDFDFDGEDIIFLSRTALLGAHSYHDTNLSTFHRIRGFREI